MKKQEFIWFSEEVQSFHVSSKNLEMSNEWELIYEKTDAEAIHWFTYFCYNHYLTENAKKSASSIRSMFTLFLAGWLREKQDEHFNP